MAKASLTEFRDTFEVNTLGPLMVFQNAQPLLAKNASKETVFAIVSSIFVANLYRLMIWFQYDKLSRNYMQCLLEGVCSRNNYIHALCELSSQPDVLLTMCVSLERTNYYYSFCIFERFNCLCVNQVNEKHHWSSTR